MIIEQHQNKDHLHLGSLTFMIDAAGALFEAEERLLVVSDLHLEKGSAFAKRGAFLPPYDSRDTLVRLEKLITKWRPTTLLSLGDTWHDASGPARMDDIDRARLNALRGDIRWIWISGNHDPNPPSLDGEIVADQVKIKEVTFRHEPLYQSNEIEIAGHFHPVAKVRGKGHSVRRKCFVSNGRRCIMPAFGSYTGGLNVLDQAFVPLFPERDFSVHITSAGKLYHIGLPSLVPN
jgi:DNA ligase-associated metallophosphoesterase